jgi:hypothetical protein
MLIQGGLAALAGAGACFAFPGDNPPPAGDDRDGVIPDGSASRGMVTFQTDAAIDRGLQYLAGKSANGAYGTGILRQGHVAVTSLAGIAFLAGGHQPGRGPYGKVVTDIVKYVLSQSRPGGNEPKGYLFNPAAYPQQGMYGHGFGTLFLAEVSGMVNEKGLRKEVHEKLRDAVAVIRSSQHREGGWRYDPRPTDADLSVTVCQMMALRAARNVGVGVPKEVALKCVQYVKNCQDQFDGSFRYQPRLNGPPLKFARTAAGVSALNSAGIYRNDPREGQSIEKALAFMQKKDNKPAALSNFLPQDQRTYYFYGHYYAVQAMWTAGGDYWANWYPQIRDELLAIQQPEGSWNDTICPHYATAMACIILQVPNNYLPILQK